jgi:hypothetical protein
VGAQRARQHTWTVGEWEWVEVPAGRFRAVRVDWDRQRDAEEEWRVTRWYAPGVGMVKERNAGHLRVLVAFTQARQ